MINDKNRKIIACLRRNARMPLTKMSKEIDMPVSTIFDNLKQNEQEFITRHTALLDFPKLGFSTRANITIKVDKKDKELLKGFLNAHPQVNSLYRINNGYDFMVEALFKEIKEMEDFIEVLEQRFDIDEIRPYYIIDEIKREGFMSNFDDDKTTIVKI